MSYVCIECGWEWPLPTAPVETSECDNYGGEMEVEDA